MLKKNKLQSFREDISWSNIRTRADHFILHVGTDGLISNTPPNEIARKVLDIAEKLKSEKCDVTISEIILRTDKPDLNQKESQHTLKRDVQRKEHFPYQSW